jgi:hypothetical protein
VDTPIPKTVKMNEDNDLKYRTGAEQDTFIERHSSLVAPNGDNKKRDASGELEYFTE